MVIVTFPGHIFNLEDNLPVTSVLSDENRLKAGRAGKKKVALAVPESVPVGRMNKFVKGLFEDLLLRESRDELSDGIDLLYAKVRKIEYSHHIAGTSE